MENGWCRIFILVPQLRIQNGSRFVKKRIVIKILKIVIITMI